MGACGRDGVGWSQDAMAGVGFMLFAAYFTTFPPLPALGWFGAGTPASGRQAKTSYGSTDVRYRRGSIWRQYQLSRFGNAS